MNKLIVFLIYRKTVTFFRDLFTQIFLGINLIEIIIMMESVEPEMHSNLDDDPTKKPIEQKTQNSSKLESLSREDLIKLVKKQLLNQKEIKKQLETAKKEAEESIKRTAELEKQQQFGGNGGGETSMLTAELNDYKNAIGIVRKELQECKERLAEKESLVEELSQRIAELQQQKEETNEELRKKLAEALELREAVEEKSKVIGENSKQINGLLVQLNESRQAMQEEMDGMRQKLQQQSQQLAAEERADLAKNAELRRMKCENETLAQRLKGIEEEFANYRERAEYALKAKMVANNEEKGNAANNTTKISSNNEMEKSSANEEVNQLVDILRQRNADISQLSAKCSFLEEEVRGSQSHTKTLVDELNALHDSIGQIRRQSQIERQRIGQEWAERMKVELALKAEMEREMKEKEAAGEKEMAGMRMEMAKMAKELEEMRKKVDQLSAEEKLLLSTSPKRQKTPQFGGGGGTHQKSINRPQKLKLLPTNCSNQIINDQLEMEMINDGENGIGMHSESCGSDSLEDLQSILQEAELAPTNDIPSFNVASLAAEGDDGAESVAINSPQFEYSLAETQQLQKQLADCRELLSESEETNIRLTEQINVLKEEIRRLERNQKRAEHLVGNELGSEYFKNIVLKFLSPPKVNDERIQLLPVLQTILHLDSNELELVRRYCNSQSATASEGNTVGVEEENGPSSGTLSDWASIFGWK